MDQFEMQKEMRKAMTARTCLLAGGLLLLFTAVTSTIMYGINFFRLTEQAAKGEAESVKLLENTGMTIPLLRIVAVCSVSYTHLDGVMPIYLEKPVFGLAKEKLFQRKNYQVILNAEGISA